MTRHLKKTFLISALLAGSFVPRAFAETLVKSLLIQSETDVDVPRITDLLGLKEGDVFSEIILEQGLQRLGESGRYQFLKASFDSDQGQLLLKIRHLPLLGGIEIHFQPASDKKKFDFLKEDIAQVIGINISDPIYLESIQEIRERVQNRLRDKGYLSGDVVLALEQRGQENMRTLVLSLSPGARSWIRKVHLTGFSKKDLRELIDYLKEQNEVEEFLSNFTFPKQLIEEKIDEIKKTAPILAGEVTLDIDLPLDWVSLSDSLTKWSQASREFGFYDFQYKAELKPGDGDHGLYIELNRGTRYNLQIQGTVAFWERELRNKILDRPLRLGVPFNITDAELLLTKLYESNGFADVQVQTLNESKESVRKVTFKVNEGSQYLVSQVKLSNVPVGDESLMQSAVEEWLDTIRNPFHKIYFDEKYLKTLLPDLLKKIRKRGFLQARILQMKDGKKEGSILVPLDIAVQLGPRSLVRSVSLEGNTLLTEAELNELVNIPVGEPVNVEQIAEVNLKLQQKYQDLGFLFVSTDNNEDNVLKMDPEGADVDIVLKVEPGPQIKVGRVIVEGLRKTKERVVLRELGRRTLKSGEVWTPTKKENLEEKLLGLGIFGNATAEPSAGRVLQKGDDSQGLVEVQEKDLKVSVSERPAGSIEFGPGYRTDLGLIGFIEWNYRNLGGWNRSVLARTQVSRKLDYFQFLEQRYTFSYLEPFLGNDPTRFRFTTTYSKEDQTIFANNAKIKGFNSEEVVFSFGLERQLTQNLRWFHNLYTISRPRIFGVVDENAPRDEKYRIGTVGTTLVYDNRNSFFNPVRGIYLSSSVEYSSPTLQSSRDAHFVILRKDFATYFQVHDRAAFALSLGYARLWGLKGSHGVPLNKRLSLGGQASIRSLREGYLRYDNQGALDQASYEAKLEYRHPVLLDLGIAYFTDIGKLESYRIGNTGWRQAVGVGFRYETAVGPLALDIAYNMDRLDNEDTIKVQFGIGRF